MAKDFSFLLSLLKNRTLRAAVAALLILGFGAATFYVGFSVGAKQPHEVVLKNITDPNAPKSVGANFNTFWQAWNVIKEDYVKADETVDQNLVYGAIDGLVKSLGDPYTIFLTPSDAQKFTEDVGGSFGGLGMEIGIRDKQLTIIAPMKNSPSERAGLKSGDKILKVDDTFTDGLDVNEAVKLIRGQVGTKVTLSILREGWKSPKDFTLTREVIEIPTLDFEMKDSDVAYVHLYGFNENVMRLFSQAALKASADGAKGMVLDLRGNPGGFLEVAVDLAGWFLKRDSVVVTEQFASGKQNIFRASGNEAFADTPLVVLVDSGSASAAEILAGALHDNRKVKLIGQKTFGKGTVQELRDLTDGSVIKITVAHWLLPHGQLIEKNGIKPDIAVALSDKDTEAKRDPQLDKALEIIKKEIQAQ